MNQLFKKILFILERGREGEREGEKHQCAVASHVPPTGDLVCNPGMCPDQELNWWPIGSQACTQSTEPHQPGLSESTFSKDPDLRSPNSFNQLCKTSATEVDAVFLNYLLLNIRQLYMKYINIPHPFPMFQIIGSFKSHFVLPEKKCIDQGQR